MTVPGSTETAPPVDAPAPAPAAAAAPEPLPGFLEDFDPDPQREDHDEPFDYQALLEADPFNPKPKKEGPAPAEPAPQATPTAPGAGQAPAGQAAKPAAVPPAAPSAPDPRDLELKLIKEQLASLRGVLDSVSRAQAPTPQPQPQAGQAQEPEAPQIPTPSYKYNIPDEWVEGLASEDVNVRKGSLAVLLQGVSQVIHRETIQHARREIQEQFAAQVPSAVQNVIQSREFGQRVESDYYGKFNHHGNFRPLVSEMTKQVFAETGAQSWSPEIRDAIGARVQNYLQAALVGMQGAGPAPVASPGVQAPAAAPVHMAPAATVPKAPHVFGGIASPGVGVGPSVLNPNSPDGIAEALSF